MKSRVAALGLLVFFLGGAAVAQDTAPSPTLTDVSCTFADGHGVRVQYDRSEKVTKRGLSIGKGWTPAGKPMLLFLDTGVSIGNSSIPLGAYGMYVVPGKTTWTLAVSKDTKVGSKSDPSQDIARESMQTGELDNGEDIATIYLAHVGPKQCNVRIVYGKTMAWGEIHEQ